MKEASKLQRNGEISALRGIGCEAGAGRFNQGKVSHVLLKEKWKSWQQARAIFATLSVERHGKAQCAFDYLASMKLGNGANSVLI